MWQIDPYSLGILFVALALVFWGIVRLLAGLVPRMRPAIAVKPMPVPESVMRHQEAVLVIQAGGRLVSMNEHARQVFRLLESETPDLERLARRVRPSEVFLQLCAAEGQARFLIEGQLLEARSYWAVNDSRPLMILALRKTEPIGDGGLVSDTVFSPQGLFNFTELAQAISSSLQLQPTLTAIVETIEKLVPSDFMQIAIWDAEAGRLLPYRLMTLQGGERYVEPLKETYQVGERLAGLLAKNRKPLLIGNVSTFPEAAADPAVVALRSYLGVPLLVGEELVGTLELGSFSEDTFHPQDLELVRLISVQAATAIRNAILYRNEQRRTAELSVLAQIAQALGETRDLQILFARLVQSIVPLLPVEVVGFLLYNDTDHALEAQKPFFGLPEDIVEMYRTTVPPGSTAEQLLLEKQPIVSLNAAEDERWHALGLDSIAQAASLRDTALIPLAVGGQMFGFLQASNHVDGASSFSQDEMRLLSIVANQAASVTENVFLVHQAHQRVQRLEVIRKVTSLTSSAADVNEIFFQALQELAQLLQADYGVIFLLDQNRTALRLHQSSLFGNPPLLSERYCVLQTDDAQFPFTVTSSMHSLVVERSQPDKPIIPFYQNVMEAWGLGSLIIVPLVVREEGIGELWLCSKEQYSFSQGDVQTIAAAASQLAGLVERSRMISLTDENLRQRLDQLIALSRIGRELNTSLDLRSLLQMVYDEALQVTRADCGAVLLFDQNSIEEFPKIRFVVGESDAIQLSQVEWMAAKSGEPFLTADITKTSFSPLHEGVVSSLVVPIPYQKQQIGLILLHSRSAGHFDTTAQEIILSLASQASLALRNALQFEELAYRNELLKRQVETLGELYKMLCELRRDRPLEDELKVIAGAIREATLFQVVLISIYEPETGLLQRVAQVGLAADIWEQMRKVKHPWRSLEQILDPQFRVGSAYFIPAERMPSFPEDLQTFTVLPAIEFEEPEVWNADDVLIVPLYDSENRPLGTISVDAPQSGKRPDRPTFEALELLAMQATLLIDNHRQIEKLKSQLASTGAVPLMPMEEVGEAGQTITMLLRKDLQQTIALHSASEQLDRVRASLEILAQAGRQGTIQAVLHTVAGEMVNRFHMQTALLAEANPVSGAQLIEVVGRVPPGINPEALFGQRNPLRQVIQDERLLLVSNLESAPEWQNCALLHALEARSFVGIPFMIGGGRMAAVLVTDRTPRLEFTEDDRYMYAQLATQVGIILQNLQLLNDMRQHLKEVNLLLEFSRKLGSLDPLSILNTLVESALHALPDANAGWVALWNEYDQTLKVKTSLGYTDDTSMTNVCHHFLTGEKVPLPIVQRVYQSGKMERVAEVHFASDYYLTADDLLAYRQATGGKLPISCLAIPIRRGEKTLGVLMLDNFSTPAAFSEEDETIGLSLCQQAALALENAYLFAETEERTAQLQALTQVAGTITSNLQSDVLIASLLDQLKAVLPYDTATLWLREGNVLTVAAASGFADNESRIGLAVSVEDSQLFQQMVETEVAISVGDVRLDERFPSLIEPENLSWLGIPLLAKSELTGVLALEKKEANFYTPEQIQAVTTFASQAAVALENARLFEESVRRTAELDQRARRLSLLNELSSELGGSLDVDHIIRLVSLRLLTALSVDRVSVMLLGEQTGQYYWAFEEPAFEKSSESLSAFPLLERLRESKGVYNCADVQTDIELAILREQYLEPRNVQSLLIVPLLSGLDLFGWVWLQTTTPYRYSHQEIELARTICNQAAIAIQNARLFAETRLLSEELEKRVEERTAELRREHRNTEMLLRVITELSASLNMDQVLSRSLEVLNEATGSEQAMVILSHGGERVYQAGKALVVPQDEQSAIGEAERMIVRLVRSERKAVVVNDIAQDARWDNYKERYPAYRSLVAVPLILRQEILGSLLLLHRQTDQFVPEEVELVEAVARQMSIAINNASLFDLLREQSEDLGDMLRQQQVAASRSRAILEAVADGVLVTDQKMTITLFNASAERILNLPAARVAGKSLVELAGLFGKSSQDWLDTIKRWSENPSAYQPSETYAEQIELDDHTVVSIHLSPVLLRNEFLGTVSIFRDITYEVQVDRLKTEFIANVSHELRTPMTSIKGYVEIMLMGAAGQITDQQRRFLEIVKSNTERLTVLVNDLLDVSRIETGRVALNLQPLDLRPLVEEVVEDIQRRSREENKPMNITLEVPHDLPKVNGDMERVRQIMAHLVSNSYSYTPAGGQITVRLHDKVDEVQIDVADNGIGIPKDQQHRIFDRFFRGSDPLVLATAGNGLGLALSKTLVEMHHGKIWFESEGEPGKGSVFSFTLPIYIAKG